MYSTAVLAMTPTTMETETASPSEQAAIYSSAVAAMTPTAAEAPTTETMSPSSAS